MLGETRIIERRKPSVCCWNSRQYERLISATPCECTAADFEWSVDNSIHVTYALTNYTYISTLYVKFANAHTVRIIYLAL